MLGELKIPGYSAYLHPIGEDLLLGVGQDADEDGRAQGTQLSIFDVSDLRKPTRLHTEHLGRGWSEAEHDHHAFLFWPRTGLVMIPFEQRAVGFRVGRARGIDPLGRVEHDAQWPIRRSVVVGDGVLTVSENGVKESSLATLARARLRRVPAAEVGSRHAGVRLVRARHALLDRRHEHRPAARGRVLLRPLRLGRRGRGGAGGGRLHDVHARAARTSRRAARRSRRGSRPTGRPTSRATTSTPPPRRSARRAAPCWWIRSTSSTPAG